LFQNEIKLIFYPDQPVSPVISARQRIFSVRGGGLSDWIPRRESGFKKDAVV
jgi:hypothetical protein